jgi:hypothetical protein
MDLNISEIKSILPLITLGAVLLRMICASLTANATARRIR